MDLPEAIRQLDKYEVTMRFSEEVTASIQVWVVPVHEPGLEGEPAPPAAEPEAEQAE